MSDFNSTTPLSSFNFTWDLRSNITLVNNKTSPLCLGKNNLDPCPAFPSGLRNLIGSFSFECPNDIVVGSLPYYYNIINNRNGFGGTQLDYVIPIMPTMSSFDSLFYNLGYFNFSSPFYNYDLVENKLSYMIFYTLTRNSLTKYQFRQRPKIEDISQCRLRLQKTQTNMNITDSKGNLATGFQDVAPTMKTIGNYCPSELVKYSKDLIKSLYLDLNVTTWDTLFNSMWSGGLFMISDIFLNCSNQIDQFLYYHNQDHDFVSSLCFNDPQSQNFLNDTCCNIFLKPNGCCVPKTVTRTFNEFMAPVENSTIGCSSKTKTYDVLSEYISLRNLAFDPTNGCQSNLVLSSKQYVDQQLRDIQNCFSFIYSGFQFCKNDSECYCSKCDVIQGKCMRCNYLEQGKAMEKCVQEKISIDIGNLLKII